MNATTLIREKPVKPYSRAGSAERTRRWIPAYGGAHP